MVKWCAIKQPIGFKGAHLTSSSQSKIILALDQLDNDKVDQLISQCQPSLCRIKVGITQFTHRGPAWVQSLQQAGFDIFLDLKFHDIPQQVYGACYQAACLGVWMVNVHALGGLSMLKAAKQGVMDAGQNLTRQPLLIGVTILTSHSQADLTQVGITGELTSTVMQLARLCSDAKLDGIVCSAHEAAQIKRTFGQDFLCVTPGIRLREDAVHDQQRVMDPVTALQNGSDYLVMGRSITHADSPQAQLHRIAEEISAL